MKKVLAASIGFVLMVPVFVSAAVFGGGETYALGSNQVIEGDLYAGGGSVTINGSVKGDLVAGGGNMLITGPVSQDVSVAGGNVNVLGNVDDDLRVAGGQLIVGGKVSGDIVAAGGQFHLLQGAEAMGDLVVVGGQIIIDGTVNGGLRPKGGMVTINGTVKDSVEVWAAEKLIIGPSAVIEGSLTYHSKKEAVIDSGAKINGEIKFEKTEAIPKVSKGALFGLLTFAFLLKLVAWLIAAFVAVRVFKKHTHLFITQSQNKFWLEVGRGLVLVIVLPIIAIILCATLIGSMLGLVLGLSFVLLLFLAAVYSGVLFGAWLWKHVFRKAGDTAYGAQAIIGTLLLGLLSLIPFIGGILFAIFYLLAVGVIANHVWSMFKKAE